MAQSMNNGNSISCDQINYQVQGKIQTLSTSWKVAYLSFVHILLGEKKKIQWLEFFASAAAAFF